jgi:hypothetical protein
MTRYRGLVRADVSAIAAARVRNSQIVNRARLPTLIGGCASGDACIDRGTARRERHCFSWTTVIRERH